MWGGSEPQWFGSLYPRLHRFLPARAILESLQASDGGHSSFFRYAGNTWESTSLANVSKVAKAASATSAMHSS
jgi:hypothetical protein